MTTLIVTVALVPVSIVAAALLEPRIESWFTRRRLAKLHGTSPNPESLSEPHLSRRVEPGFADVENDWIES